MASNDNNIENLKGSWDYIKGENFELILKELGVNTVVRTIAKNLKPKVTISEQNGKWLFKSDTTFKIQSYQFIPGEEFEDVTPDGQHITMIVIFENGKWIQTGRYKDGKTMTVERWVNDEGQLQVIMKCGKVEATQLFKRAK